MYNSQNEKFLKVKILFEVLKKAVSVVDVIIIVAATFLLSHYDFGNLTTANKIFLGAFVLWVLMLFIRIYIVYKDFKDS